MQLQVLGVGLVSWIVCMFARALNRGPSLSFTGQGERRIMLHESKETFSFLKWLNNKKKT
jgi:hypothetical protein